MSVYDLQFQAPSYRPPSAPYIPEDAKTAFGLYEKTTKGATDYLISDTAYDVPETFTTSQPRRVESSARSRTSSPNWDMGSSELQNAQLEYYRTHGTTINSWEMRKGRAPRVGRNQKAPLPYIMKTQENDASSYTDEQRAQAKQAYTDQLNKQIDTKWSSLMSNPDAQGDLEKASAYWTGVAESYGKELEAYTTQYEKEFQTAASAYQQQINARFSSNLASIESSLGSEMELRRSAISGVSNKIAEKETMLSSLSQAISQKNLTLQGIQSQAEGVRSKVDLTKNALDQAIRATPEGVSSTYYSEIKTPEASTVQTATGSQSQLLATGYSTRQTPETRDFAETTYLLGRRKRSGSNQLLG